MPNEQEEFLKDLNPESKPDDVFGAPPEAEPVIPEPAKDDDEQATNRRERRLAAKLQAERESSIALAARLEAITEAQKSREESGDVEYLKTIERIYGTNSPEAVEATELLKNALLSVEKRATERALEQFRAEREQEAEEVVSQEKRLDEMVEEIEDEVGSDMDKQTKQGFFMLLEKLSPKDRDGNIIEYADHFAVWEELQARKQAPSTRAKDLAARSMVQTGASPKTTVDADATERWLREQGLI